jgi:hypothetical protein
VNADDVAADRVRLIEQMQRQRRVCAGEIVQHFANRVAARLQLRGTPGHASEHRWQLHANGHE